MQLSPNFSLQEFELDGPMPVAAAGAYTNLCRLVLEPIRSQFGEPMIVTSGYRSQTANQAAGGVLHSEHQATDEFCAADWYIESQRSDLRPVFDWIRSEPSLPFHQVILEHDPASETEVIHISWNSAVDLTTGRQALEGETNNLTAYKHWDVCAYFAAQNIVTDPELGL
jgi:zinc D-Ala-D-Ala carboxypeptidase